MQDYFMKYKEIFYYKQCYLKSDYGFKQISRVKLSYDTVYTQSRYQPSRNITKS